MRLAIIWLAVSVGALVSVPSALAQHATEGDIADGERAFGASCVVCHGPDGNLIEGIDLGRGLYRRDYSDADLVDIIINGIADTPMPPNPGMSAEQAERIVGYLRSLAGSDDAPVVGDRGRGRDLFFGAGDCTACHAVNGRGMRHGPDLTSIGASRRASEIETALIDPGAQMLPENRRIEARLANGERVSGRLLNHDTFTLQLIDEQDRLRSFEKAELREYFFTDTSMPDYSERMTTREIADLVSYLTSLQGPRDD